MKEVLGIENRINNIENEISNLNFRITEVDDNDFSAVETARLIRKKKSFEHELTIWKFEDKKRKLKETLKENNLGSEKIKKLLVRIDDINIKMVEEYIKQDKDDQVCLLRLNKAWMNYYKNRRNDGFDDVNAKFYSKLLKPTIKNKTNN